MTNLSNSEVDNIANEVRNEMLRKQIKRRKQITAVVVIAAIVVGIVAIVQLTKKPPVEFVDDFSSIANGWDIYEESFEIKRFIDNGTYVWNVNKDDWCYWDYVPVTLPENYSIEMTSVWKKGKFDEYGMMLLTPESNYYAFQMRSDGAVSYAADYNDKWVVNASWHENFVNEGNGNISNTQLVQVNGNHFAYYVNGDLYKEEDFKFSGFTRVGMRVCDQQSVDFTHFLIKDASGNIIYEDSFDAVGQWEEKVETTNEKHSEIKDGQYIFTTNKEDYCYWTSISIPTDFGEDFDVTLRAQWLKGEASTFGLMLLADDENFHSFEVRSDGKSRYVNCYYNEYDFIGDWTPTGFESTGENALRLIVKVRGDEFEFFINDFKVQDGYFDASMTNEIGLRCCGRQTIAFDHLEIKEID